MSCWAGITASNVTFSGGSDQIGLVSNSGAALGLEGEVMLNTDHVSCTSTCTNCGGLQSDADLEFVANSVPPLIGQSFTVGSTYDVARLEFDFVADGDSISFDYVFGSDEYLTYVNTQFNDIFAFFLSGPGINGPFTSPPGFPGAPSTWPGAQFQSAVADHDQFGQQRDQFPVLRPREWFVLHQQVHGALHRGSVGAVRGNLPH